jgi:hypothetical protein
MRHIIPLALTALTLAACTMQAENGGDVRVTPSAIFGQAWTVTQQLHLNDGNKICTVSFGEVDVTQRSFGKNILVQVGKSGTMDPGYTYKILTGGNFYQTADVLFGETDSKAIIHDFMQGGTAYTELAANYVEAHRVTWHPISNKINLGNFASMYQGCTAYVK